MFVELNWTKQTFIKTSAGCSQEIRWVEDAKPAWAGLLKQESDEEES